MNNVIDRVMTVRKIGILLRERGEDSMVCPECLCAVLALIGEIETEERDHDTLGSVFDSLTRSYN